VAGHFGGFMWWVGPEGSGSCGGLRGTRRLQGAMRRARGVRTEGQL
jgi:hypothetical protein